MNRVKIEIGQEVDVTIGNFKDHRGAEAKIDVNSPVTIEPADPANLDQFAVSNIVPNPDGTSVTATVRNVGATEVSADFIAKADGDPDTNEEAVVTVEFGIDVDSPNAVSGDATFSEPRDPVV